MKIEATKETEVVVFGDVLMIRQNNWPDDGQVVSLTRAQAVLVAAEIKRLLREKDWSGV